MDNTDDVIDSRDVIERIAEIRDELAGAMHVNGEPLPAGTIELEPDVADELRAELATLEALVEQIDYSSGDTAADGVTLIRDTYFKDYAIEFAEEIGAIPSEYTWPTSCIDWDQAARELRMDYSSLEFDGVTYWVR